MRLSCRFVTDWCRTNFPGSYTADICLLHHAEFHPRSTILHSFIVTDKLSCPPRCSSAIILLTGFITGADCRHVIRAIKSTNTTDTTSTIWQSGLKHSFSNFPPTQSAKFGKCYKICRCDVNIGGRTQNWANYCDSDSNEIINLVTFPGQCVGFRFISKLSPAYQIFGKTFYLPLITRMANEHREGLETRYWNYWPLAKYFRNRRIVRFHEDGYKNTDWRRMQYCTNSKEQNLLLYKNIPLNVLLLFISFHNKESLLSRHALSEYPLGCA